MYRLKKLLVITIAFLLIFTAVPTSFVSAATGFDVPCKSAIIYCGDTDQIIWEKNIHTKLDPASMTKLLTALIVVENVKLDKKVTVTSGAYMPETNIDLVAGEVITVENLLYALLLHSANDAANALAIEVAGSVDKFAVMMNEKAKALGCKNSNFVNPSGWQNSKHYSTAYDMALITKAALANKTVRKISGTAEYKIPATNKSGERKVVNYNGFLKGLDTKFGNTKINVKKYDGVFGGKTGNVGNNKNTLAIGLDCDGLEIYCVIMGSTTVAQRYTDMKSVMDHAKAIVVKHAEFEKGDSFGKAKLTGGAKNRVKAIAENNGYINMPEGASASLVTTKTIFSDSLMAPVKKGQKVGVVEIYIADDLVKKVDLVAEEDIEEGWFLSSFGISNLQTVLIGIVLAAVLGFGIMILTLRAKNKREAEKRRQAKLKEVALKQMEIEQDKKARDWTF